MRLQQCTIVSSAVRIELHQAGRLAARLAVPGVMGQLAQGRLCTGPCGAAHAQPWLREPCFDTHFVRASPAGFRATGHSALSYCWGCTCQEDCVLLAGSIDGLNHLNTTLCSTWVGSVHTSAPRVHQWSAPETICWYCPMDLP